MLVHLRGLRAGLRLLRCDAVPPPQRRATLYGSSTPASGERAPWSGGDREGRAGGRGAGGRGRGAPGGGRGSGRGSPVSTPAPPVGNRRAAAVSSPTRAAPRNQDTDIEERNAESAVKRRRALQELDAVAPPQPSSSDPTWVPRDPRVKDGLWNTIDQSLVAASLKDAAITEKRRRKMDEESGFVLLGRPEAEIAELAARFEQPAYRARQLMDGVLKGARRVEDIPVIPKAFKDALTAAGVRTGRSIVHHSVAAPDGTRKFLLQLHDGRVVETVGIPVQAVAAGEAPSPSGSDGLAPTASRERLTVCVSSQVGCPMRCTFCATGKGGFARSLEAFEILDQVMTMQEAYGKRVTNVVFMGMGEPLLNLPSVAAACALMHEQLGLSARSITVSTVGVPNAIAKLAAMDLKATLAVSIHAPNQTLRESIIPSAKAYPLDALMADCAAFFQATGRRVTFEYTLMAGVNDGDNHAKELAQLLRKYDLMSHVNIIPWNPVDESEFKRPSNNRVYAFQRVLENAGVPCSRRVTRGLEAAAACGQLRNQHQKAPLEEFLVPT
ncbi:hypothetical protein FOA52_007257 [Chlamydomonas sp. UWO 241]|nr:hypothetical protein FOA52_007257 [Chlamydomonas sp. UWO 241]